MDLPKPNSVSMGPVNECKQAVAVKLNFTDAMTKYKTDVGDD